MSTTIDNLQIEIQSNASSAAQNIEALSKSLEGLKSSGKVTTAIKNLDKLSASLKGFTDASNATRSIGKLVGSLSRLKEAGSVTSIASGIKKLSEALQSVQTVNVDSGKMARLAEDLRPLSNIKAGGLNSITNGLLKLDKATDTLNDTAKIDAFVDAIKGFDEKLDGVAPNLTTIGNALKAMKLTVNNTSVAVDKASIKVFNLSNAFNVLQNCISTLNRIADSLMRVINQAIEWDGISARFGRGFGEQAEETYEWIKKLNEEMHINVQQFMQYSSTYATMLKGFGVANEDASKMALGYTELTYDIWAGYNDIYKNFSDAADAVRSAIAGEVEPIRRAGFTIVEATLKQTAANHGLEISLANATEAQKSYLRYLTLVDQAHSQNLVGTYAKELSTAEGVMRTFSQQLKSVAQTFGSLFLPLLVKGMPYLQAFIELLTEGVHKLAAFFGVTIQEIDWTGYNTGANSVGDLTDSLESATEATKDLKKATVGIDELNVISPNDSTGSGSGSGDSGFDGLDVDSLWDDSIFDNITSQVEDIKKKLQPTMDWLENHLDEILTSVGLIGATILGWKLVTKIRSLKAALLSFKGIKTLVSQFKLLRSTGKSVFSSLTGSISKFRSGLTGLQKGSIVAVAAIMEFTSVKGSVKELALGCEDVGTELVNIGITAAAAGTAMYVALGPWGLALAAVVGLVAALQGVSEANQTLVSEFVETTVFDDYGIAIDNVTGILENLWESLRTNVDRINDLGSKVEANDEIILNSQEGIKTYMSQIETAGTLTKEQAESMSQDVKALADAIQENLGYNTQIIFEAFSDVSKETAKQLGMDVGQMTSILNTFKGTFSTKTAELESVSQKYLTRLAKGEILDDAEIADLDETLQYLNDMSGQTFANQEKVKRAMSDLTDVNFGSVEDAQQAINDMTELGKQMNTDLDQSYETALNSISTMMGQAKTMLEHGDLTQAAYNQFAGVLSNYKTGITDSYNAEKENIKSQMDTVFGYIEAQVGQSALDAYEKADYSDMNWWQKIWYSGVGEGEAGYKRDVLKTVKRDVSDPLFTSLDEARKKAGLQASSVGRETVAGLYDGVKDYADEYGTTSMLYGEAENAIAGYKKGIEENTKTATDAFKTMTQDCIDAVASAQDSHSPAKKYISLAKDAVDGYKLGVEENIGSVKKVWANGLTNIANSIKTDFTKKLNAFTDKSDAAFSSSLWRDYADNVTNALSKIKMPSFKTIKLQVSYTSDVDAYKKKVYEALGFPGWPQLKFAASGGVFDQGSLIWAGERGPEIMATAAGGRTGVMNVQQMSDAMFESVYSAMMAAQRGNDSAGTPAFHIYLDGKEITASVEKRQRERGASIMGNQVYSY